ncbi:hypothetical protein IEQ34_010476 [Dendrobium chrysotoxum]|uniref:Uncharacterized protein n=1 Tax=Dendrobium chrysotoxum TaxID=161865 RepID=A0AAV7GVZ5_DENCH|nr:hypothetical protein IEQ34_010476 [Dendrobium chrysotoxum]
MLKFRPYIYILQGQCYRDLRSAAEMDEDEHEVYGGEIPDVAEMEGDMEALNADVEMARADADADAIKELEEMKKRLKEMEEEAAALREMHAKVEKEMGAAQGRRWIADQFLLVMWDSHPRYMGEIWRDHDNCYTRGERSYWGGSDHRVRKLRMPVFEMEDAYE